MAGAGPLVSLVILAHNHLAVTRRCVPSLRASAGVGEVILVDNGSHDATLAYFQDLAKDREGPPCRVLHNPDNPGLSRTRNQGAAMAQGSLLAFVDNDVYATDPEWLQRLVAVLDRDPTAALVGPLLVYPFTGALDAEGQVIQSAGGGVTAQGHFGLLGRGQPASDPRYRTPRVVAWLPTACLVCRREVFVQAGGFDETLDPVSLGEDIDLCMRVRSLGYRLWTEPAARLCHFENVTTNHCEYSAGKRAAFLAHMRRLRQRWWAQIQAGPLSAEEEIRYVLVKKDYRDLDAPKITVYLDRLGSVADPTDGR